MVKHMSQLNAKPSVTVGGNPSGSQISDHPLQMFRSLGKLKLNCCCVHKISKRPKPPNR